MAAGDEGDGFLVVHGHAPEGFADVESRLQRVGIAVRTFGVDVDQAHLHRGQRLLQIAPVNLSIRVVVGDRYAAFLFDAFRTTGVADIAAQPRLLCAPVNILIRLPCVRAPPGESEGLEAHRLQPHVSS